MHTQTATAIDLQAHHRYVMIGNAQIIRALRGALWISSQQDEYTLLTGDEMRLADEGEIVITGIVGQSVTFEIQR